MQPRLDPNPPTGCRIPLDEQFADLADLKDGWYNGDATAYVPDMLARVKTMIVGLMRDAGAPVPYVYPTQDGEVRAEWQFTDAEALVLFDDKAASAMVFVTFKGRDESRDVEGEHTLDEGGLRAITETLKPHFADPSRRVA